VQFTERDVRKKIRDLKKDSAAGPDEIGPKMLQELVDELAWPLTKIFRASLDTGDVPNDWKTANVTPIYKKGSKMEPEKVVAQTYSNFSRWSHALSTRPVPWI